MHGAGVGVVARRDAQATPQGSRSSFCARVCLVRCIMTYANRVKCRGVGGVRRVGGAVVQAGRGRGSAIEGQPAQAWVVVVTGGPSLSLLSKLFVERDLTSAVARFLAQQSRSVFENKKSRSCALARAGHSICELFPKVPHRGEWQLILERQGGLRFCRPRKRLPR